jgi:tRNA-specific 2-thiouridylase
MSGGVDSSTAAALLKEQGYELVGFSMQLWDQRRNRNGKSASPASRCCSLDDIHDARAVAGALGFPYYVLNFHEEFEQNVVRYFIESYRDGTTPSPCVLCNSHMKFDHLVRMADEVEASHVATGHYARVFRDGRTGRYRLLRGLDLDKDQSYFLFELSQDQLARALFPLGELTKREVREIARRHHLETADKAESQEICFVPDGDYASFIETHYRAVLGESSECVNPFRPGEILDREGKVLGTHDGVHKFTIGQRRGLGISHSEPLYVVGLEPSDARVIVGTRTDLERTSCRVVRPNWISISTLEEPLRVEVKIRSRHRESPATIFPMPDGSVEVRFEAPQSAVTPGQACVFYCGDDVTGGGWIARHEAT